MKRLLIFLLGLVMVAGCGNANSPTLGLTTPDRVVKIGVIAPLDAGLTEFGRGIRNSVQLAVDQANQRGAIPGWRLVLVAKNDSSDPTVGAAAAKELAADPNVLAVVGTYNSGVASAVNPILAPANIVMISPANTDPKLTRGDDPNNPVRPFQTYFRVVVPDSIQGPELANYAFLTLGKRRSAIVTLAKSVSRGLAEDFQTRFLADGGTVTSFEVVPDDTTDFSAVMARVAATNPDLLFFGGEYQAAAPARQAATAAGLTVPLMGGDGIQDQAYITLAGPASEGDFASSVGAPLANLPGGAAFAASYNAAGFADPASTYGPYAYDAANLIIAAATRRIGQAGSIPTTRPLVLADIQATNTTGVTGQLGFDSFGDTIHKVVTFYKVTGALFVPQQTVEIP